MAEKVTKIKIPPNSYLEEHCAILECAPDDTDGDDKNEQDEEDLAARDKILPGVGVEIELGRHDLCVRPDTPCVGRLEEDQRHCEEVAMWVVYV